MKKSFLHGDFFNYMRALNLSGAKSSAARRRGGEYICAILAAIILDTVLSTGSAFYMATDLIFFIGFFYAIPLILGLLRNYSPSLLKLLPINYKKHVSFSFIVSFLDVVICILFVIVVWFVFYVFTVVFIGLITCGWELFWEFGLLLEIFNALFISSIPLSAKLFEIIVVFLTFFVAMLITYLPKKKMRIAFQFIYPALIEVFILVATYFAVPESDSFYYNCLYVCFDNLPLPWLWLTLLGVLTLGVAVFAVVYALKRTKPFDIKSEVV